MNKQERLEYLTATRQHWTVWRISNRWLRAAIVWLIVPFLVVFLILLIAAGTIWSIGKGAVEETRQWFLSFGEEWERDKSTLRLMWAAMTGKDAI